MAVGSSSSSSRGKVLRRGRHELCFSGRAVEVRVAGLISERRLSFVDRCMFVIGLRSVLVDRDGRGLEETLAVVEGVGAVDGDGRSKAGGLEE
jgi:hypothetical protein